MRGAKRLTREERNQRDRQLLDRSFSGDDTGIDTLIDEYLPLLIGYFRYLRVTPENAEDLAQETLFRVFRSLETFDRTKPLVPWLMAIARNTFLDWRKSAAKEQRKMEEFASAPPPTASVEEIAISRVQAGNLLAGLPAEARFLVEMRILVGLPFAELADLTGEPETTLRSRLCRILARLREHTPVRARSNPGAYGEEDG